MIIILYNIIRTFSLHLRVTAKTGCNKIQISLTWWYIIDARYFIILYISRPKGSSRLVKFQNKTSFQHYSSFNFYSLILSQSKQRASKKLITSPNGQWTTTSLQTRGWEPPLYKKTVLTFLNLISRTNKKINKSKFPQWQNYFMGLKWSPGQGFEIPAVMDFSSEVL